MLALTRKVGDKIFIGDNIIISFLGLDRGKIRVGIDAPREIMIRRDDAVKTYELSIEEVDPNKILPFKSE